MGLHILRHKSWHVWNQDNRERVLRDERLAKEEEEHKKQRAIEGEQEFRLSQLRKKIKRDEDGQDAEEEVDEKFHPDSMAQLVNKYSDELQHKEEPEEEAPPTHINLFEKEEMMNQMGVHGKAENPEYVQEQKMRKLKKERQQGLRDTELDQATNELKAKDKWLATVGTDRSQLLDARKKHKREEALKKMDPKYRMDKLLAKKKRDGSSSSSNNNKRNKSSSSSSSSSSMDLIPAKKQNYGPETSEEKMQRLRLEKMARELDERARIAKMRGIQMPTPVSTPRTYSSYSQYNPQAAREADRARREYRESLKNPYHLKMYH